MNKTELITYLRKPNQLTSEQLDELEKIVNDNPYFLSARLLLAKASREKKHPQTKKRIASAAIYSTDRILLKKYLNDDLFFLKEQAKPEEETVTVSPGKRIKEQGTTQSNQSTSSRTALRGQAKSKKVRTESTNRKTNKPPSSNVQRPTLNKKAKPQPQIPDLPSGQLDSILEELKRDMENLKSSREKFAQVQEKIVEDDAVSAAIKKVKSTPKSVIEPKEDKQGVDNKSNDGEKAKQKALELTKAIIEKAKLEVQEEEDKAKTTLQKPSEVEDKQDKIDEP
ncbi:MAG: hypothetical protein AAFY41_11690, partial [Bacteroidota bacterium]